MPITRGEFTATCPVCGSSDLRMRRVLRDLTVATCGDCTLSIGNHVGDPRTTGAYAPIDEDRYRRSIGRVREWQAQAITARVLELGKGGRWVDVGAGFGFMVEAAQRAGFDASGVEPEADAAAAANVTHGTIADVEGRAEVISTLDVLEHLPPGELSVFAAAVRERLEPRGAWVVKVPTTEGVLFRVAHLMRARTSIRRLWQCDERYPHTVYFNRRSLRRFLEREQFEIVHESTLEEVPRGTIVDRLTFDGSMPRWRARIAAPVIALLHALGSSDALLVIARRRD